MSSSETIALGTKDAELPFIRPITNLPKPMTSVGNANMLMTPRTMLDAMSTSESSLRDVFYCYDLNHDGLLDEDELHELLRDVRVASHQPRLLSKEARDRDDKVIESIKQMARNSGSGVDFNQFVYIYNNVLQIEVEAPLPLAKSSLHVSSWDNDGKDAPALNAEEVLTSVKSNALNLANSRSVAVQSKLMAAIDDLATSGKCTSAQQETLGTIFLPTVGLVSDTAEKLVSELKLKVIKALQMYASTHAPMHLRGLMRHVKALEIELATHSGRAKLVGNIEERRS